MNLYEYDSYREFFKSYFAQAGKRGEQTKLAAFLNCQTSFISQVLTGAKTHFSLEHISQITKYLKLDAEQSDYLILLCLYEKAGTKDLQEHFYKKIVAVKNQHQLITAKISKRGSTLSNEQKAVYYSHWAYMAIHMAISIPDLSTEDKIRKYFNFPQEFVSEIFKFLIDAELIEKEQNHYKIGKTRIHLENTSPLVRSLHSNWRQKAIDSLIDKDELNLHYSSVLILSKKDALKIKQLILELIKEKEKILLPSPEEQMVIFNLDYFKL
jgi:uncharacterized protein (TIGR02147 family)